MFQVPIIINQNLQMNFDSPLYSSRCFKHPSDAQATVPTEIDEWIFWRDLFSLKSARISSTQSLGADKVLMAGCEACNHIPNIAVIWRLNYPKHKLLNLQLLLRGLCTWTAQDSTQCFARHRWCLFSLCVCCVLQQLKGSRPIAVPRIVWRRVRIWSMLPRGLLKRGNLMCVELRHFARIFHSLLISGQNALIADARKAFLAFQKGVSGPL